MSAHTIRRNTNLNHSDKIFRDSGVEELPENTALFIKQRMTYFTLHNAGITIKDHNLNQFIPTRLELFLID